MSLLFIVLNKCVKMNFTDFSVNSQPIFITFYADFCRVIKF